MTDKADLRARIAAARRTRGADDREQARTQICQHVLAWCAARELPAGSIVAGYQPLATEPGSEQLLAELDRRGYRVIVPLTLADRDLDWLSWPGAPVAAGSRQPPDAPGVAQPMGRDAIADTALILVPAFAVDRLGARLGRGGGSYDRALARASAGTPVAALLYADELVDKVPTDPWDRPVSAAVTPRGWIELTPTGRRNTR